MERTSIYASKISSREVGNGLEYDELKKTIVINILDFELFPTEEYISETAIVLGKHREHEIIKDPKWYFIELPKFRKIKPDIDNPLEQWLLFIDDYDRRLIKMAENKNKTLKEARTVMNYLTGDEEIKRLTELREKWAMDRTLDIKSAEKETSLKIATEMLKNGESVDKIMKYTKLTKEEIENLIP